MDFTEQLLQDKIFREISDIEINKIRATLQEIPTEKRHLLLDVVAKMKVTMLSVPPTRRTAALCAYLPIVIHMQHEKVKKLLFLIASRMPFPLLTIENLECVACVLDYISNQTSIIKIEDKIKQIKVTCEEHIASINIIYMVVQEMIKEDPSLTANKDFFLKVIELDPSGCFLADDALHLFLINHIKQTFLPFLLSSSLGKSGPFSFSVFRSILEQLKKSKLSLLEEHFRLAASYHSEFLLDLVHMIPDDQFMKRGDRILSIIIEYYQGQLEDLKTIITLMQSHDVSPSYEMLKTAIRLHKLDIIELLLEEGVKPDRDLVLLARECLAQDNIIHKITNML